MGSDGLREVIEQIKQSFDHAVIKGSVFSDEDCSIKLDGLNNCVALKSELISQNPNKMCDCIIFKSNDGIIIGIVEMKGGKKS